MSWQLDGVMAENSCFSLVLPQVMRGALIVLC